MLRPALVALLAAGCRIGFDPQELTAGADAAQDADAPDPTPDAQQFGPWGPGMVIPGADTAMDEQDPAISSTGLELIFAIQPDLVTGTLFTMTRPQLAAEWSAPAELAAANLAGTKSSEVRFAPDDRTLYFGSDRDGDANVYFITRAGPGTGWGPAQALAEVNTSDIDKWFAPCAGGRYLMVRQIAGEPEDIFEGQLGVQAPQLATGLNTAARDSSPYVTPDCLTAYFASDRDGALDLFVSTRSALGDPWSPPTKLELSTAIPDQDPALSADGTLIVWSRGSGGNNDVYLATRARL